MALHLGQVAAIRSLRAFCEATLRNSAQFFSTGWRAALVEAGAAPRRRWILYVSRRGSRAFVNAADAVAALQDMLDRLPRARALPLREVVLEEMSLADQVAAMHGSVILVAAHGQALAWLPFLATHAWPTAVVEVALPYSVKTWMTRLMYSKWAHSLQVRHISTPSRWGFGCNSLAEKRKECALRVSIPKLVERVEEAAVWLQTADAAALAAARHNTSRQWCKKTPNSPRMLPCGF
mmetsp:Transcript_2946/g.6679  ORF Transcript_2946/g.6679 Transcript_2946/m.6679 type:complete len:236 (-) Transcript_2946:142-849(-)